MVFAPPRQRLENTRPFISCVPFFVDPVPQVAGGFLRMQ
jgi:hypothetical protein